MNGVVDHIFREHIRENKILDRSNSKEDLHEDKGQISFNDDGFVRIAEMASLSNCGQKEERCSDLGQNLPRAFNLGINHKNDHPDEQAVNKASAASKLSNCIENSEPSFADELNQKRLKIIDEANEKQRRVRLSQQRESELIVINDGIAINDYDNQRPPARSQATSLAKDSAESIQLPTWQRQDGELQKSHTARSGSAMRMSPPISPKIMPRQQPAYLTPQLPESEIRNKSEIPSSKALSQFDEQNADQKPASDHEKPPGANVANSNDLLPINEQDSENEHSHNIMNQPGQVLTSTLMRDVGEPEDGERIYELKQIGVKLDPQ